jgi:hypothetical protein
MRGTIPPLLIRLYGVCLTKHRNNFNFTFLSTPLIRVKWQQMWVNGTVPVRPSFSRCMMLASLMYLLEGDTILPFGSVPTLSTQFPFIHCASHSHFLYPPPLLFSFTHICGGRSFNVDWTVETTMAMLNLVPLLRIIEVHCSNFGLEISYLDSSIWGLYC